MNAVEIELLNVLNHVRRNKGLAQLESVPVDADLRNGLSLDSLDLAELTVRIEERFGIDVFEAGIVQNWREVVARVNSHVGDVPR